MDGGAVTLLATGQPLTAWCRENALFTCFPGGLEQQVATGRNITLAAAATRTALAWDEVGVVWLKLPIALGEGQTPSVALTRQATVCVWEARGQVMMRAIAN